MPTATHTIATTPQPIEPADIRAIDRLAIEAVPLDIIRALRFALLASELRAAQAAREAVQ